MIPMHINPLIKVIRDKRNVVIKRLSKGCVVPVG